MTSKQALELAILEYKKDLETDENNQLIKDVLKGLKECQQDLKVLETLNIIKRFMMIGVDVIRDDDINRIKEWLENGKRENDRNLQ